MARFENVYVYSKSLQQPKYRFLENLLAPIEEIGYFTFSNNNDVLLWNEVIPVLSSMMWLTRRIREYFAMSTRGRRLLLFVSDIRKDIEASYTR